MGRVRIATQTLVPDAPNEPTICGDKTHAIKEQPSDDATRIAKISLDDKNIDTSTVASMRCQKNAIHLDTKENKMLKNILVEQMMASRIVYNQALYFQRSWFTMRNKMIDYYIDNMNQYMISFSTEDKKVIFSELIRRKDCDKIDWLYFFSCAQEVDSFKGVIEDVKKINPEYVLSQPMLFKRGTYTYQHDARTYKCCIAKVGTASFDDKNAGVVFLNIFNIVVDEKIRKNDILQREKKVFHCENHLIPPSYLPPDMMEHYVKIHFGDLSKKNKYNALEMIGSQVAQQTMRKLDDAYKSFFAKMKKYTARRKNNKHKEEIPRPPSYSKTNGYSLIFQKTSFRIALRKDVKYVKLSLGLKMKKRAYELDPQSKGFLWFKVPTNIIDKKIEEIEITPCNDGSICYINYKYSVNVPLIKDRVDDISHKVASIDFGVVNLITTFSLHFDNPLIYKGGYVNHINNKYKHLIEKIYQPAIDTAVKKDNLKRVQKLKDHVAKLWRRRDHIIGDHFNKVSSDFIKKCSAKGINEVILGYNPNWKISVNMGHINNDKFCKIPYRRMVGMIFNKAKKQGIRVIEHEEAYTSKCDALAWENIGKQQKYSGERLTSKRKRGLFVSGKKAPISGRSICVNSDVNGAMNIMRKGLSGNEVLLAELKEGFKNHVKICNARVVNLTIPARTPCATSDEATNENSVKHKMKRKHIVSLDVYKSKRRTTKNTKYEFEDF